MRHNLPSSKIALSKGNTVSCASLSKELHKIRQHWHESVAISRDIGGTMCFLSIVGSIQLSNFVRIPWPRC